MSPHHILILIGCCVSGAAWIGHTPESREYAEDILATMREVGMAQKEMAYALGLSAEKFCRQLAGLEPLNAWRLQAYTSPVFRAALVKRQAARLGIGLVNEAHVAQLIASVEELIGSKRMAKAEYPLGRQGVIGKREAC